MDEHHPLERAQLLARLEAELVEREPRLLVGGERVDLPTGAVERQHLQSPQPLACRVLAGEPRQLADELGVHAELELRLDPLFEGSQVKLVEPARLRLCERLEGKVSQGRAMPELERVAQASGALARGCVAHLECEPLEAARVDRVRRDAEHVAGRTGLEELGAEHPAQPRDAVLDVGRRRARRRIAPQLLDQRVDRDDLVGVDQQERQQRPLLGAAERQRFAGRDGFQRPQQAKVDRSDIQARRPYHRFRAPRKTPN